MEFTKLLLRAETKSGELRTPLLPRHARKLLNRGVSVLVERSPERIFTDGEFRDVGCELVDAGSWRRVSSDTLVLGLKELPLANDSLEQTHCYFAHCFKGQPDSAHLLRRFSSGGGTLLDLEYLTGADGRRVAAFGYWAGFMGAALGLMAWSNQSQSKESDSLAPLDPWQSEAHLKDYLRTLNLPSKALVTGFRGRSGKGAVDLLCSVGVPYEGWDREETARGGPFPEWITAPLLVHCVASRTPGAPFLTDREVDLAARQLSVLVDVTCDTSGPLHLFPFFNSPTSLSEPTLRVRSGAHPLDVIAIDHLPTLLPRESSAEFANMLFPYVSELFLPNSTVVSAAHVPWLQAQEHFIRNSQALGGY